MAYSQQIKHLINRIWQQPELKGDASIYAAVLQCVKELSNHPPFLDWILKEQEGKSNLYGFSV